MIDRLSHLALTGGQRDGLVALAVVACATLVGLLIHRLAFGALNRLAAHRERIFGAIVHRARRPSRLILPLLCVLAVLPNLELPAGWATRVEHLVVVATIAATAWGIVALVLLVADFAKGTGSGERGDDENLRVRQIETRVDILSRVAVTIVVIVATAACLMTFPAVRAIGATLLASAGLAGLAVGLATRPVLENLIAGVQIALTQPIRIDDVVIVEKEFGRIEEITATYVVVALWDRRRLIVPLTYFIDKPFENWTRHSADLIGTVMLYADYSLSVDTLREELDVLLARTPLWDGKVKAVQVTDTDTNGMQIRILVSARNAAQLFDLRCIVREGLIAFVQQHHPSALPIVRLGDANGQLDRERRNVSAVTG